jgi:hypothetical protein
LAIVVAMPENESDPIANTQMFRRFADQPDPEPAGRRRGNQLVIVLVVLAVILAGVVVWLASR